MTHSRRASYSKQCADSLRHAPKPLSIVTLPFLFVLVFTIRGSTITQKIREVDFKNSIYPWDDPETGSDNHTTWFWTPIPTESKIRLINGQHRFTAPDTPAVSPALRFSFVAYRGLDGDGIEEAAAAVNYTTGGTMNWDYLYVYKLAPGKPKLLGRLRSGSRGSGGLLQASINQGALVLDFADPDRRPRTAARMATFALTSAGSTVNLSKKGLVKR